MGRNDRHRMPRQVETLQRLEGLVAVFVDENAGVPGLLPHILDLQLANQTGVSTGVPSPRNDRSRA